MAEEISGEGVWVIRAAGREADRNTIAMVYDFDGTLSPQPMQDYTVLPAIGMAPAKFWRLVDGQTRKEGGERMLVYMRLLLEKAYEARVDINREDFTRLARRIRYYPGVMTWFGRINRYVARHRHAKVRHYIVSAGLREILKGAKIAPEFTRIYASEYHYDYRGVATFPKVLITDTTKTQFLFRINKGREDLRESINDHMSESKRPVPFSNIIYIGDAMSDVPSMAVTRRNGGNAVAVYDKRRSESLATCKTLLNAGRVDFIAPADYRARSPLSRHIQRLLDRIIAEISYRTELGRDMAGR